MSVWRVLNAGDDFADLHDSTLTQLWHELDFRLRNGSKPNLIKVVETKGLPVPDFPYMAPGLLAARADTDEDVLSALEDSCFGFDAEGKHRYRVFLPRQSYNAFNSALSDYRTFKSSGRIAQVKRIAIDCASLGDASLFRLAGDRALHLQIFASDHFRRLIEDKKCTGLGFTEISPDPAQPGTCIGQLARGLSNGS